jgi:hypothetical protein
VRNTRAPALAYPQGGRTKTLTLTEDEASEVAAALARSAAAKAELDARAATHGSVTEPKWHRRHAFRRTAGAI